MVIDVKPNTRHHRPSGAPTWPSTSGLYRHYADNAAIKTVDSCLERWNQNKTFTTQFLFFAPRSKDLINRGLQRAHMQESLVKSCRVRSKKRLFQQWKRRQNAKITLLFPIVSVSVTVGSGPLRLVFSRRERIHLIWLVESDSTSPKRYLTRNTYIYTFQTEIERHLSSYGSYVRSYTNQSS